LGGKKVARVLARDDIFRKSESELSELKAVFHMGACSDTTERSKAFLSENNLEYSKRIFTLCTRFQIPLIYASSGAVYGNGDLGFSDDLPPRALKPLNLYGWSKAEFDVWALEQKERPPSWYGVRFFNVYGPNEYHKGNMASVAFKAFQAIRQTGRLQLFRSHNPLYRDGEQKRDFVYVKDVTRWMTELWLSAPASGIYNLGYGQARTWLDLAGALFAELGRPVAIDWVDTPLDIRSQYQYFTEARMEKARNAGLTSPLFTLEDGIRDYVQNYLLLDNRHA
jgi:ADP-L-glycero-D-manno-heptose 6-epimerase